MRVNNIAGAGVIEDQNGSGDTAPLVFGQWAEVKALIDLDNNTLNLSYNGTPFHSGVWDIDNPGSPSIGGLNWWADSGATPGTVYLDDLSLTQIPEPSAAALFGLAGLGLILRRRR